MLMGLDLCAGRYSREIGYTAWPAYGLSMDGTSSALPQSLEEAAFWSSLLDRQAMDLPGNTEQR